MPETISYPAETEMSLAWQADIMPEHGGHCVRLNAWSSGSQLPVLEDIPLETITKSPTSYGCPILFPYAGRLADGTFHWQGKKYQGHPLRHGLVRHHPWDVIDKGASQLTCAITVEPAAQSSAFPFHFTMQAKYKLSRQGLMIHLSVHNLGCPFPYSCGVHPYLHRGRGCQIKIPAEQHLALDSNQIPIGTTVPVQGNYDLREWRTLAADLHYDDIFTGLVPRSITWHQAVVLYDIMDGCAFTSFLFDRGAFPFLCLYTPPQRCAVCIEPYTSAPDALNHPDQHQWNLQVLAEGESVAYSFGIGLLQ